MEKNESEATISLLCECFNIAVSAMERKHLAAMLLMATRKINTESDELLSLLYIECGESKQPLTFAYLATTISRVSKRLYRESHRVPPIELARVQKDIDQAEFREELASFVKHLKLQFGDTEMLMFELIFVENQPMKQVMEKLGLKKSAAYEMHARIKKALSAFISRSQLEP